MRFRFFTLGLLIALILTSHPLLHAAEGPPAVFDVLSYEASASSQETGLNAAGGTLLTVDQSLLQGDPEAISVALPDGGTAVAKRSYSRRVSSTEYHWFGNLDDSLDLTLGGSISFHSYQGRLIGSLRTADGAAYQLTPDAEGHRLMPVESSGSGCGLDHSANGLQALQEGIGEGLREGLESLPAAVGTSDIECLPNKLLTLIDVMVLYPLSLSPQAQAVQDFAVAKVAESNMIFNLSGVGIIYQLKYVGPITAEQPPPPAISGPNEATQPVLNWINDQFATTAINNEVELLRKAHGADMISIVVPPHPNNNCGIANLPELRNGVETMFNSTAPFGKKAFTVLELGCGNSDFTFAHELGHNFGMRHEIPRLPVFGIRQPILPWAYGYDIDVPGTDVASVMACYTPPFNCRRVMRFSNPDVNYQGVPTGLHSSQSNEPAHNACVAHKRAGQYAVFASPRPSSPPSLVITSPAEGAQVTAGTSFNLIATATDPEDGDRRAFVQWRSDRDGFLGSGSPRAVTLSSGGPHLITAEVTDTSGTKVPYSIRLSAFETDPPRRYIDNPSHNEQVFGSIQVTGWATDSSGVDSITFKVDGVPATLSNFFYGTHRADVCAVHSDLNDLNCPLVGFRGTLNTEQYSDATHTLQMTTVDTWGNSNVFNRTFRKVAARTFDPTDDAYVSEADPNGNFGNAHTLKLRGSGSGQALHTYTKFTVTGITRPVQSATLQLRNLSTELDGLHIYWMQDSSWNESTITWNNASLLFHLHFPTSSHPAISLIEVDVSSIVSGNGTYTIGMVSPDSPNQEVRSSNTLFGPKLVVTF
ncbi:MAG: DNRLRE domain-containing protein [Deltaproteobacteria bacterium]|nr:DNRLRE domain-containing protein [Deltaproteobacteria bacterium]